MSNKDKNIFGGANVNGLYVPMTDVEQEALSRIREADDLEIVVHGWCTVDKITTIFGDHRVGLQFRVDFTKPAAPMAVFFLDLELRVRSSHVTLFRQRYPTAVGGQPLQACAGVFVDLQWDIAIDHMSPALVKALVPGAIGLTSRRLDRDTGVRTTLGNMDLTQHQQWVAQSLDDSAQGLRKEDEKAVEKAAEKQAR